MTATVEQANESIRRAVVDRMAAMPSDDPKMVGYKLDQGDPEPSETYADWQPPEYARTHVMPTGFEMRRIVPNGSEEWLAALERLRQLHVEKTGQYGGAEDAFENVTASAKCGVEPWRRALCDLSDCVVRMQKFAQGQPVDPTNALLDAANWALICLIKLEESDRA